MPILTQAHHDHFDEYGYMVIEDAVPIELCEAVVDAIFDYLEMDPSNPNDWYRAPHKPGAGMVDQHSHLWDGNYWDLICGINQGNANPYKKFDKEKNT